MRKVYILPNLFTAGSLFCGMLAIYKVFNEDLRQACWLILMSAILDVFDGAIARLTGTTSDFGLNFDSLSDLVAFGVAPALLAYHTLSSEFEGVAAAICSLFVVFGALRLARFNVQAGSEEKKTFLGLPIPMAGLAVISVIWVLEVNHWVDIGRRVAVIYATAIISVAYLMVSKVPYYGFKSLNLKNRQPFEIFVTIVMVVCLLYILKEHLDIVLLCASWIYIFAAPVVFLLNRHRPRSLGTSGSSIHTPHFGDQPVESDDD
jgi:CDP-diacylglycerol--serine O-phosphatidyltransferase